MAGQIDNDSRDALMTLFRERVCERLGVAPFEHQRKVWCASDGLLLLEDATIDGSGVTVRNLDGSVGRRCVVGRPEGRARFLADLGAFKIGKSYGAALWGAG